MTTLEMRASLSLSTQAARTLATTTKSEPQMRSKSSRWLLRKLPWVDTAAGTYRVNQRLTHAAGEGRAAFHGSGGDLRVVPQSLSELPILRGFDDWFTLAGLAERLQLREYQPGDLVAEAGRPVDEGFLVAHGKLAKVRAGEYGDETSLGVMGDGEYLGAKLLADADATWEHSARALTPVTVLVLRRNDLREVVDRSPELREHIERLRRDAARKQNKHGEAEIELASGHDGEPVLPTTFVDYELAPREYELSVAQTILRVHTRVADLFNKPMDQVEQQLRLTVEALRERQEQELLTNPEFGLLRNVDYRQRIRTRSGPPTPDDMDELLSRRRNTAFVLAHPRAIAAFGRECNARGVIQSTKDVDGVTMPTWRGVPILPSPKIPISANNTTSMLAMRIGEEKQGVVGLRQSGIPDELEPSLNVRYMGIDEQARLMYLVSAYYSAAVLVPDALGVLENVELGR